MRNILTKFALTATLGLAITFTLPTPAFAFTAADVYGVWSDDGNYRPSDIDEDNAFLRGFNRGFFGSGPIFDKSIFFDKSGLNKSWRFQNGKITYQGDSDGTWCQLLSGVEMECTKTMEENGGVLRRHRRIYKKVATVEQFRKDKEELEKAKAKARAEAAKADADDAAAIKARVEVKKGSFTDARDNKTYKTVSLDNQTWMAENLNFNANGSKCYDNKPANCDKYGHLYDWETAKTSCPSGWYLPSEAEWEVLTKTVGGEKTGGKHLKAASGWDNDYDGNSGNGTDALGFAALPGDGGNYGFWWSASEHKANYAYYRKMGYNGENVHWDNYGKDNLLSVRCVQGSQEEVKVEKGSFTDVRDSKTYKTVGLGNQTWMAENLNFNANGSKCYKNDPANCDKYGHLYDWETAKTSCPSGWHLPRKAEWEVLTKTVGSEKIEGNYLKAASGWNSRSNFLYINGNPSNGMDKFGFSALPGGSGSSNGGFFSADEEGGWWSASEKNANSAYFRSMLHNRDNAYWSDLGKGYLFSVRCVQYQTQAAAEAAEAEAAAEAAKAQAEAEAEAEAEAAKAQEDNKVKKGSFTDARDSKTYKTVGLGNQTWMAENLNFNANGSKCYKNDPANCDKYGHLYDWKTAKTSCPSGWHLPSDAEWTTLTDYVGDSSGIKLKATSGWNRGGNGTDEFGFAALPGGRSISYGDFSNVGDNGSWWSATENNASNAWAWGRDVGYDYANVIRNYNGKTRLFSVRCVQGSQEEVDKAAKAQAAKAEATAKAQEDNKVKKGSFTDARDKKSYKTIKIGTQTWMAENLNHSKWLGSNCYDNNKSNCEKYGRLYNWSAAKSACPKGWHLPTQAEWDVLTAAVGGASTEGKYLKATSGWNNNGNGTDAFGFAALPGGAGKSNGSFSGVGSSGDWWSASERNANYVYYSYYRGMSFNREGARWSDTNDKFNLFSVRCLQD